MLNQVQLIGYIVGEIKASIVNNNKCVNFSLVTNPNSKTESHNGEFHNIVFYGRYAEITEVYLSKGKRIYVEGRLQTNSWEKGKETIYKTYIIGEKLGMFNGKNDKL